MEGRNMIGRELYGECFVVGKYCVKEDAIFWEEDMRLWYFVAGDIENYHTIL